MGSMSDYFLQITDVEVINRYRQKILAINSVDPFTLDEASLSFRPEDFPPVSETDIVVYLVFTTSYYTKQQVKAYKSLSAYKYFKAGFVSKCGTIKIGENFVVVGKVRHSQKMNEIPLRSWIICKFDGSIETAHCTCMAGAGEACSHVGALLYAVSFIFNSHQNTSCTDVAAEWKVPTIKKVEFMPIKNIDFGREINAGSSKIVSEDIPPIEGEELVDFLKKIEETGSSSVLQRVVEPFASEIASSIKTSSVLNIYSTLYNENYEAASYEDLMMIADEIELSSFLSDEDCAKIEQSTRQQHNCIEWFNQKQGRITASLSKRVCSTSIQKPSLSLIKNICYPTKVLFKSKATEWRKHHEKQALETYRHEQNLSHSELEIKEAGLFVKPQYPYLGATPDALVNCSCCSNGCVEVKCPYNLRKSTIMEFAEQKSSCLEINDGQMQLKRNHQYYFQVQQQMALTNSSYCDFVVWSPKEMYLERILFNEDFFHAHLSKLTEFHRKVILPELIGKFFTRATTEKDIWCLCKGKDDGMPMIKCDNECCEIQWYHMACIGLTEVPTNFWICAACSADSP